jgi:hypothetical protein
MFRETAEGTTQHFIKLQQQSKKKTPESSAGEGAHHAAAETDCSNKEAEPSAEAKVRGGLLRSRMLASAAKYIPVRVSEEERVYLRLLEGALDVSEYTDKVDVVRGWGWRNSKLDTIREEIGDLMQQLLGLAVAANYKQGTQLIAESDMERNAAYFRKVIEIGRRFKITNPEKMRCSYGKLIYLLQDSASALSFSLKADIRTVYSVLEGKDGLALLEDEDTATAIDAVSNAAAYGEEAASRAALGARTTAKQAAIERLCSRYATAALSSDDIRYCLASLADFNSFIDSNRRPVDDMLILLQTLFDATKPEGNFSLEISSGLRGSKLSHSHATQFTFVFQTLTLWQKTTDNMFRLWILAERVCSLLDARARAACTPPYRAARPTRRPGADEGWWGRAGLAQGGQQLPAGQHRAGPQQVRALDGA